MQRGGFRSHCAEELIHHALGKLQPARKAECRQARAHLNMEWLLVPRRFSTGFWTGKPNNATFLKVSKRVLNASYNLKSLASDGKALLTVRFVVSDRLTMAMEFQWKLCAVGAAARPRQIKL